MMGVFQKRKVVIKIVLFMLLACLLTPIAAAAGSVDILREQSEKSGMGKLYGGVPENAKRDLNQLGVNDPKADSLAKLTPQGIFRLIAEKIKAAAAAPFKALATVLGVLLVCALLSTLKNSFGEKPLKQVFDTVCALCVAGALLIPISQCIASAADTIKQSSQFMLVFLPVFVSLVAASGHPASALAYQGLLMTASQAVAQIASTTFVPMVNIYLAFCVIGSVSPGVNIGGIAGFARKIVAFGLTLCLTVFVGILTIQGLIAQAADTVAIKTAKFLTGSVVPVIGGCISDALNTVVSCANLLKTAAGAYAIVVFALAFLPPLLECLLWLLAADVALAVSEILAAENVSGLLKSVKEALRLLIAMVLACALAMLISVSVMLLLSIGS